MKKLSWIISLIAFGFAGFLASCTDKTQTQNEMQQPVTTAGDTMPQDKMKAMEAKENEDAEDESKEKEARKGSNAKAANYQNLQGAFKGETTASARYAAYSKKAEAEGFYAIAMLFKAASASEQIHANNHKAVLEEAGQKIPVVEPSFTVLTTKENLKEAIAGETYEITTMYPRFLTDANAIADQFSLASLNYAYKTEQKHKAMFEKTLVALETNKTQSLPTVYYVCQTCGNTYESTAPKRCGISMTSGDKFLRIGAANS